MYALYYKNGSTEQYVCTFKNLASAMHHVEYVLVEQKHFNPNSFVIKEETDK